MKKTETAIQVENLSKVYYVGKLGESKTWRQSLVNNLTSPVKRLRSAVSGKSAFAADTELWALKDISFSVRQGEVLGIIGPNGSGKSTLLKILSQITLPSHGRALVRGQVGSLLEVGTGFHQELTGRENVYMNASILGISAKQVNKVFDQIVEFSGVGDFLDTPVKRYSSGMRVRLAFSVAVHLQPEIVLIDEVLSVGDAGFRKSSLDKIATLANDGRTVLLVSHNLQSIQNLCSRAIYLNKGRLLKDGDVDEIIETYLADNVPQDITEGSADLTHVEREEQVISDELRFTRCEIVTPEGEPLPSLRFGQEICLRLQAQARTPLDNLSVNVRLSDRHGTLISGIDSAVNEQRWNLSPENPLDVIVRLGDLRLPPGSYVIGLSIREHVGLPYDFIRQALTFDILEISDDGILPTGNAGLVIPRAKWNSADILQAQENP